MPTAKENSTNFGISTPTLITGGIAVLLAYKVGSSILEKLGLKKSEAEQQNDEAATAEDAWKGSYWQTVQQSGRSPLILTQAAATAYAKTIENYPGVFNDDYASVLGVIKSLKTKTQVSFLAYTFNNLYNKDMYQFLRNGNDHVWFGQGLSDEHVKQLNDYVKKLPDYKI